MKDTAQEQYETARRNQILDAAAGLFAQQGFHITTIKDIAKEAGIADGTVYNYFKNKTALLLAIFNRMRSLVEPDERALQQLIAGDLPTFLRSFLQIPLNTLNQNDFQLFKVVISEMMVNEELRAIYHEQILEPTLMLAEGYFEKWAQRHAADKLDTALIVRSVSSLITGLMIQNIMGDTLLREKWDELPGFLTDLLLNGLEQNQP
jgi:TetR/AcrR family fatty acid metabolism transcriptional regulator